MKNLQTKTAKSQKLLCLLHFQKHKKGAHANKPCIKLTSTLEKQTPNTYEQQRDKLCSYFLFPRAAVVRALLDPAVSFAPTSTPFEQSRSFSLDSSSS